MQEDTAEIDAQLRDKVWMYAQRGVVVLVFFLGGILTGYRLWGQATQLQEKVEELTERNQSLVKERDTERSKVALVERDKKELQKRLEEAQARAAAAQTKAEEAANGGAEPAAGAPPQRGTGRGGSEGSAAAELRNRSAESRGRVVRCWVVGDRPFPCQRPTTYRHW